MEINRRHFLRSLIAAAVAVQIDPVSFVNKTTAELGVESFNKDLIESELKIIKEHIKYLFERDDMFFAALHKAEAKLITGRDMRIPLKLRSGS